MENILIVIFEVAVFPPNKGKIVTHGRNNEINFFKISSRNFFLNHALVDKSNPKIFSNQLTDGIKTPNFGNFTEIRNGEISFL